jgi:phosphohistidine phosphatase
MMLYLCRHAIAEENAEGGDFHRALTAEGKVKFRRAAKGFLSLKPEVSHVLSSPLLRARQTAEILVEAIAQAKLKAELDICDAVGIPADIRKFLAALRKLKGNVVAVGHEPTLSEWIGEICFGAAGGCEMKKGAIAAIEMTSASRGTLLWMMRAGQLAKLG